MPDFWERYISDPDFDEFEEVPAYHQQTRCPGTLEYYVDESVWGCSEDKQCPLMQEVLRIHSEGN